MRGGQQQRIEDLAICRRPSGELLAVPAGDAMHDFRLLHGRRRGGGAGVRDE